MGLDSWEASKAWVLGQLLPHTSSKPFAASEGRRPESSAELSVSREKRELLLPDVRKRE